MNILLFNQYAGNKGDRAVLYATCRIIKDIHPNANIYVSTSSPELYKDYSYYQNNNITFIPTAWDYARVKSNRTYWKVLNSFKKYTFTILREIYLRKFCYGITRLFINPLFRKAVKQADKIISVGGHHYCTLLSRDLVSGINFDAMAIKLQNKSFTCFSQTFGPFDFYNKRNLLLTRDILINSKLYPREEDSRDMLLNFQIPKENITMTFETVLSLSREVVEYVTPSYRPKTVGIAIYCTQKRSPDVEENYLSSISSLCNHVIKQGYDVKFFPMELKGTAPDDRPYIQRIVERVEHPGKCYVYDTDMETAEHLHKVGKCQVFIGHKTHSTIFALATGTPLLAIAYHPKTIEFMHQFGMKQFVVDDKVLTNDKLIAMFDQLSTNLDKTGKESLKKSKDFTEIIYSQFNEIINI
ncbi:MAG: polysaccharide pyruvyl transferase family protein [Bacteroidaceae bacterium]|nr:polysaccharide pyruvyl transferase family protein [Bacteroidaceae bacterium]